MSNSAGRKAKVRLSIDTELAAEAEARGEDLSLLLETALLRQRRWLTYVKDNGEAIEANNAQLERDGMWYEPDWLR